jgi:hypothetical protein
MRMSSSTLSLASLFILIYLCSCSGNYSEMKSISVVNDSILEFQVIQDTLVNLTELEPCDILVKPNYNWFAGSAMVNGGMGFGHVVLVLEAGKDTSTMNLLEKIRIFESQARDVPGDYELRSSQGYQEGTDFRFANITFGPQNTGYRYRLRFNLTPAQRDSIIQFVLAQDPDVSSWRSLKRLKSTIAGNQDQEIADKKTWYCSLLIWEAFYKVVGVDLDANGGIMVFPNDLIASPYFTNDSKNKQKRVRF